MRIHQPKISRRNDQCSAYRGFTLIELILVMVLMVIVVAFVGPSLGNFFKGRTLDSEARRFVSLTRFAQNRAVSEGVPMVLWIDAEQRLYGLLQENTYGETDLRPVTYELGDDVEIEVDSRTVGVKQNIPQTSNEIRPSGNSVAIRFLPDGFIGNGSPQVVWLKELSKVGEAENRTEGIWITQSRNGATYDIQTNNIAMAGF